jgi:chromosome partitioning protein
MTTQSALPSPALEVGIDLVDVSTIAERAMVMMNKVRARVLAPHERKKPPVFSTTQLSVLCQIDKSRVNYLATKGELPSGQLNGQGRARSFTLSETRQWIFAEGKTPVRPASQKGKIIAVCNFKGGSTKTSTCASLAQGLTLKGRKVLIVDLDPQGSLTNLCGLLPDAEIAEDMTVMPFVFGEQPNLRYAVMGTYWDGLDLIPAAPALFTAEQEIPAEVARNPHFAFWDILRAGLEDLTNDYDVIIIDTAPSLSYLTINAMLAANGLIVPIPPNALDFASSAQFWNLFSDLAGAIHGTKFSKRYDFINVLLTKVNLQDAAAGVVREWIQQTYTDKVLTVEIPLTTVTSATSIEFGTVYDVSKWDGSAKTYVRAREAYDRFVELIDQKLVNLWATSEGTQ